MAHILYVEDREDQIEFINDFLPQQGHSVKFARTIEEAYDMLRGFTRETVPFDVAITDWNIQNREQETVNSTLIVATLFELGVPTLIFSGANPKSAELRLVMERTGATFVQKPDLPTLLEKTREMGMRRRL